ncbi:alpha/beta hydrolase [Nocardia sp. BMG51109]|uniref:alpha/beta hydrolase n=1 Tax=Nocardia sp. BMG51109 TaxID=1056816 RepID=UPI00046519C9|nr:alpha/beta hydrolase [Nocardia sp. BMG51109]
MLRGYARIIAAREFSARATIPELRRRHELLSHLIPAKSGVGVTRQIVGGLYTEVHTPCETVPGRMLLYIHGGGFCLGNARTYRGLVSRLADQLGAVAYVPNYRLAPEDPFPAAVDDVLSLYSALVDDVPELQGEVESQGEVVVAGDSAGGGLTLSLAVAAREQGLPLPTVLGMICPALDLREEARVDLPAHNRDPVLTTELLNRFSDAYCASADTSDPRMSPLLADMAGLPPMVLDTAELCPLRRSSQRLRDKCRAAGIPVRYSEYTDQGHVFHISAGIVRDADLALNAFGVSLARSLAVDRTERSAHGRSTTE